jgi:hypothetical protein
MFHWNRYGFYTVAVAMWEAAQTYLDYKSSNNLMKLENKFQISAVTCMPQHQDKLGGSEVINGLQEDYSFFTINAQARTTALMTYCFL